MITHLLLDADLAAYRAAAACQKGFDWGDGVTSRTTDIEGAKDSMREFIGGLMYKLKADKLTVCLSDDFRSFRKEQVDPTYKGNRKDVERPEELYRIKAWLEQEYDIARTTTLEADDVMGILSTTPDHGEKRIIVSQDKDMRTIPGYLYRPYDDNPKVILITEAEADWYHMYQTLVGDAVDGYPGCPSVGPKTASECLTHMLGVVPVHTEISRGPNKGTIRTRWEAAGMDTYWEIVLSHFARAGLGPKAALTQARLARILRWEDCPNGRVRLWSPPANKPSL